MFQTVADGTVPPTRVDLEEPWIAVSLPETCCVPNIITQIPLIFNLGTWYLLCQGLFIPIHHDTKTALQEIHPVLQLPTRLPQHWSKPTMHQQNLQI